MIALYYHGGSANHGCEAIVRSTQSMLKQPLMLFSSAIDEEYQYCMNQVVTVREDSYIPVQKGTLKYLNSIIYHKLHHNDYKFIKYGHQAFFSEITRGDICLSIGGDNYCYAGIDRLGYYNKVLHQRGAKTVLWGCSIEPSILTLDVVEDLKRYDLITVRESLSYEGLRQAGVSNNVVLCPDPAFQLEKAKCKLPIGFTSDTTIGINVSPLAVSYGNIVMDNYKELMRYLIEKTEYKVLLIPHVVKRDSDDREILQQLYECFQDTDRVYMVSDYNCMELKSLISQCRMFIGARTHATIAAYSTCVPTLGVGYSIKARGIAKDIFGQEENFVISVQKMKSKTDLMKAFCWLQEHENDIKKYLENIIPEYCQKALIAGKALRKLVGLK